MGTRVTGDEWPHGGPYRYLLTRRWGPDRVVCFIMLNPSTATAEQDDPTVTRCRGFARREGCGGMVIVNLFGLRSPSPRMLLYHPEPIGPSNDETVFAQAGQANIAVAAWGTAGSQPRLASRRDKVEAALSGISLWCLGTTKAGEPRHPLMARTETPLIPWEAR
ncbi:MAG: DUF1643 domain-containing protein [Streptosporangiaceae bacterium]